MERERKSMSSSYYQGCLLIEFLAGDSERQPVFHLFLLILKLEKN